VAPVGGCWGGDVGGAAVATGGTVGAPLLRERWFYTKYATAYKAVAHRQCHQPPWELRVGDFRVFYDINHDDQRVVIVAMGKKTHNRLKIAGEEIQI
jgi:hypothetical protein